MANSHTVNVDGVGPVLFERSQRAKHVSISVKPFTGVRVAVPDGLSFKKAEEFVRVKKDWILRHLNKMKQYEKANNTICVWHTNMEPLLRETAFEKGAT